MRPPVVPGQLCLPSHHWALRAQPWAKHCGAERGGDALLSAAQQRRLGLHLGGAQIRERWFRSAWRGSREGWQVIG